MSNDLSNRKELIRFASRPVLLILFVITSALFINYGMLGNTIVDTWCWFTLAACCEWILEKPLSAVVGGIKNKLTKKPVGG